jgi:hypothetical protein
MGHPLENVLNKNISSLEKSKSLLKFAQKLKISLAMGSPDRAIFEPNQKVRKKSSFEC